MPIINYTATGDATESEMDSLETAAKDWHDGASKVLHNLDKRYDVDAVQITLSWEVAEGEVDASISTLDTAIQNLGVDLPLASEAATVDY